MKLLNYLLLCLALVITISSCDIINPTEPVPTYVRVDSFTFKGNPVLTGTNSQKITCVYAYVNNQSIGIFELPKTFPVLMDGKSNLMLIPGIQLNGFSGVPIQYPFFTAWQDSFDYKPGEVTTVSPSTSYHSTTKVYYNCTFEGANPFGAVVSGKPSIVKTSVDSLKFEGNYSGLLYLDAATDSSTNINSDSLALPTLQDVYLELNYKSNIPFVVGLYTSSSAGIQAQQFIAGFNAHQGSFNKVYVALRNFVNTYSGGSFSIVLRGLKDQEQQGKDGYVVFDNIKIVSFE